MIYVQPPRKGWTKRLTVESIEGMIRDNRIKYRNHQTPERFSAIVGLLIVLKMLRGDKKLANRPREGVSFI